MYASCFHTADAEHTHWMHRTRELGGTSPRSPSPLPFHAVQFLNVEHIESKDFCSFHHLISRSLLISSCYLLQVFFYPFVFVRVNIRLNSTSVRLSSRLRLDVHPICFPRLHSARLNKPDISNIK